GVNWMWPSSAPVQSQDTGAQAAMDAPIARIHSAQKWPDKIDFDTSKPTIVPPSPPPAPVLAQTGPPRAAAQQAAASPLGSRAEVKPTVQSPRTPPRKRVARVHHRYYPREATSTWAEAYPTARSSWSWNW